MQDFKKILLTGVMVVATSLPVIAATANVNTRISVNDLPLGVSLAKSITLSNLQVPAVAEVCKVDYLGDVSGCTAYTGSGITPGSITIYGSPDASVQLTRNVVSADGITVNAQFVNPVSSEGEETLNVTLDSMGDLVVSVVGEFSLDPLSMVYGKTSDLPITVTLTYN